MKTRLRELTRPQLIALATQKTDLGYQDILKFSNKALIEILLNIDDVLDPVPA